MMRFGGEYTLNWGLHASCKVICASSRISFFLSNQNTLIQFFYIFKMAAKMFCCTPNQNKMSRQVKKNIFCLLISCRRLIVVFPKIALLRFRFLWNVVNF